MMTNIIESDSELHTAFADYMSKYGGNFRTFKHGAMSTGMFLVMPITAINALFERKGFKYIAINAGFWIVTLAVMSGIICQYAKVTF